MKKTMKMRIRKRRILNPPRKKRKLRRRKRNQKNQRKEGNLTMKYLAVLLDLSLDVEVLVILLQEAILVEVEAEVVLAGEVPVDSDEVTLEALVGVREAHTVEVVQEEVFVGNQSLVDLNLRLNERRVINL